MVVEKEDEWPSSWWLSSFGVINPNNNPCADWMVRSKGVEMTRTSEGRMGDCNKGRNVMGDDEWGGDGGGCIVTFVVRCSRSRLPNATICNNPSCVSFPNGPRPWAVCALLMSEAAVSSLLMDEVSSMMVVCWSIFSRVSLAINWDAQYDSSKRDVIGVRSPCRCTICTATLRNTPSLVAETTLTVHRRRQTHVTSNTMPKWFKMRRENLRVLLVFLSVLPIPAVMIFVVIAAIFQVGRRYFGRKDLSYNQR